MKSDKEEKKDYVDEQKCDALPAPLAPVEPLKAPNTVSIPKPAAELLRNLQRDVADKEKLLDKCKAAFNVSLKMLELMTPEVKQGESWTVDLDRECMVRVKDKKE